MSALLLVVLIPTVFSILGALSIGLGALGELGVDVFGTAYARWRYTDRFEQQFGELTSCLEQSLGSLPGDEARAAAEGCCGGAELYDQQPCLIKVLAPIDGELRWQDVHYVDSSYGLEDLHEEAWSDGLHLISVACAGHCLLYVHTLPEENDPTAKARAYSIVVPLSAIR